MWDVLLYMSVFYWLMNKAVSANISRVKAGRIFEKRYTERVAGVREMPCSCQKRQMPCNCLRSKR